MKASDTPSGTSYGGNELRKEKKPYFRPAKDDTKPVLQDPILQSDPIVTEEAVLRLPPFPFTGSKPQLR